MQLLAAVPNLAAKRAKPFAPEVGQLEGIGIIGIYHRLSRYFIYLVAGSEKRMTLGGSDFVRIKDLEHDPGLHKDVGAVLAIQQRNFCLSGMLLGKSLDGEGGLAIPAPAADPEKAQKQDQEPNGSLVDGVTALGGVSGWLVPKIWLADSSLM